MALQPSQNDELCLIKEWQWSKIPAIENWRQLHILCSLDFPLISCMTIQTAVAVQYYHFEHNFTCQAHSSPDTLIEGWQTVKLKIMHNGFGFLTDTYTFETNRDIKRKQTQLFSLLVKQTQYAFHYYEVSHNLLTNKLYINIEISIPVHKLNTIFR